MVIDTRQEAHALRVWVTDDDPDDHLLFSLAAEEADLDSSLTFLFNGGELLEMLSRTSTDWLPEIIVLDLRMPGMGGHRTLHHLRSDPRTATLPVIVFTTSTRHEDRDLAIDAGASAVVVKPIRFPHMVEFVASLADRVCDAGLIEPQEPTR